MAQHLTRRNTAQDYPLDGAQLFELTLGPNATSAFADAAEARAAWEANRDHLIERVALHTHDCGWRPEGFWYFDVGDPDLGPGETWREDEAREPARLRYLWEHDLFLPGELEAMERTAKADADRIAELAPKPNGEEYDPAYASKAWKVIQALEAQR